MTLRARRIFLCHTMILALILTPLIASALATPNAMAAYASPQAGDSRSNTDAASAAVVDTFMAQGSVNGLVPFFISSEDAGNGGDVDAQLQNATLFLLGGDWVLSVNNGTVDDFIVRIEMVAEDGTLLHYHTIQNLSNVTSKVSPLGLDSPARFDNISISAEANDALVISGFADITTNGVTEWEDVAVTVSMVNGNVMSIIPNPAEVDHFYALPIYGIVTTLIGKSGEPLGSHAGNGTVAFHGRGGTDFNYASTPPDAAVAEESNETDASSEPQFPPGAPNLDSPTGESPSLDSTRSIDPIIEKTSENGGYLVQLRWSPSIMLPLPGLNYQIFFLNPVQPQATEEIVPSWESNFTGFSMLRPSMFIDPDIIMNFEAVDSYDMTVYSDAGNVLWQKEDLPAYGGRDQGFVTFEEEYRGPITIEITDIQPAGRTAGTDKSGIPDSVTFASLIVE